MDHSKSSYIAALWDTQDSLLQNYRSLFITIESIFIAVSITIQGFNIPDLTFLAPIVLIGLYVNKSWLEITSARGLSVHFLQTILRRHENPTLYPNDIMETREPFERLRLFQDNAAYRAEQMSKNDFITGDFSRAALGSVIPCIFFVYWLFSSIFIFFKFLQDTPTYSQIIHTYTWGAIVLFTTYLTGALILKMLRKERNPEYRIPFFRFFLLLIIIIPGVIGHVHAYVYLFKAT
ncbi:hypothetical protein [Shewanella halifaxensis]|uniref:hypothetical protein n=1 Tax=Shewanella halifaxensis TaxID=271098 RepID=UPI000D591F5B|nr:hypothetical protein [Shewanella halifaxensis]